jgi:Flp pilus assembly protein TadD
LSAPIAGTIETSDPVLTSALLLVAVKRTPETLVKAAHRYYQLGIRDRAMDFYAEALERDSRHAAALDGRARVLRDWGILDQALGDAHRAKYFAPSSAEAWNTFGTILQAMNRLSDARAAYSTATRVGDPAPYAWSNLCYLSFVAGDAERALEECSTAVALAPGHRQARNNLALIHAARGELARASELFLEAGGEAAAHYNMGIVWLAEKNYSAAARAFEAAVRVDPSLAQAHIRARQARKRALAENSHDRN